LTSELNKVYTNGTLVDPELLTDEQAGHCIALREAPPSNDDRKASACFGLCVLDTSTSEFNLAAFADDVCRTKLETMIRQLRVKEIIYPKARNSLSSSCVVSVRGLICHGIVDFRTRSLSIPLVYSRPSFPQIASGLAYAQAKVSIMIALSRS
jgi:DNA mismatch repair ATPase MutS